MPESILSRQEPVSTLLGAAAALLLMLFGIAQFVAAYAGIAHFWGGFAAAAIIGFTILWRFFLPITIGSFCGALYVLKWHWAAALAFAAPGLLFVVPTVVAALFAVAQRALAR